MRRLPFTIALLMLASAATAQVYKWTDHSGTIHYAETPPPTGVHYTLIKASGGESSPPPAVPDAPAQPAQPAAATTAPVADTPQNRATLCASLQSNLDLLRSDKLVVMQGDAEAKTLDADQRQQQTAAAEAKYRQYCAK